MARSFKIVGAVALAAVAACTTEPTAPALESPALLNGVVGTASGGRIVVTESDIARQLEGTPPTRNWVFYTSVGTASGAFVSGPENSPLGVGSFEMRTPLPSDKATLFNYDHIGTRLADIDAIAYATYRDPTSTASPVQLPSINIQVDYNGSDVEGFTTLVFEPVYNPAQGSIQAGVWQEWDGDAGIWWSTRPISGVCAVDCYVSWSNIVAANPNATILGGFGVNQGSGNGGLFAATDALTLGVDGTTWVYDFEPFRSPATKDDCKKSGWEDMKAADGSSFKNQGQCIKYVNETSRD